MKKTGAGISFKIFVFCVVLTGFLAVMSGCTSPLHRAIINENPVKAREIINKGDTEKIRQDRDALVLAVESGQIEVVEALVNAGVDVNARSRSGNIALVAAVSIKELQIVKLLIENGADVIKPAHLGVTPLIVAFENEHRKIQELLIQNGADVNAKGPEGWAPLMYTALRGDNELAELLIKKGADVNAQIRNTIRKYSRHSTWDTALHIAIYSGHEEIVFLLVKNGSDLNAKNRYAQSPMYCAVDTGNIRLADFFIQSGAKPFILERNADDVYITAKTHQLFALNNEKRGDIKEAKNNYTIAAKYFERATPMLLKESKRFRTRKFFSKLSNILQVLGASLEAVASISGNTDVVVGGNVDVIPSSRINKLKGLQKEYKKRSEESRRSAMECRNILQYLEREKK